MAAPSSVLTHTAPPAVYMVGRGGRIYRTLNNGRTWLRQKSGTTRELLAVSFANRKVGYAAGEKGVVVKTINGGATWRSVEAPGHPLCLTMDFIDARTGWLAGADGLVLATTDGGKTWDQQAKGVTGQDLWGVDFVDASSGWAVGDKGVILHTADGGGTWTRQDAGTSQPLNDVSAVDGQSAWIAGGDGDHWVLLSTTNGGGTWTSHQLDWSVGEPAGYQAVAAVDMSHVMVGGMFFNEPPGGDIFASSDGTHWTEDYISFGKGSVVDIDMLDTHIAWAISGAIKYVFRTTDGGAKWTRLANPAKAGGILQAVDVVQ